SIVLVRSPQPIAITEMTASPTPTAPARMPICSSVDGGLFASPGPTASAPSRRAVACLLIASTPPHPHRTAEPMSPPPPSNTRILIVDDNEDIHRDFRQIL